MRTLLIGTLGKYRSTPLPTIPVGLWLPDLHQRFTTKRFVQADWTDMKQLRPNWA